MAVISSLPQPLIAVPVYLFVERFIIWESVGLGFAAGAMFWVACFELIPDAAQEVSITQCSICLATSFMLMLGISMWLQDFSSHAVNGYSVAHAKVKQVTMASTKDENCHFALAVRMGLGSHAYVLPLVYSLLAGLSTGIGGLLCLPVQGSVSMELPMTAFMLASAAAAMITVSVFDLFYKIVDEIGLKQTLIMSLSGASAVLVVKEVGGWFMTERTQRTRKGTKEESERRLLRVGLMTAVTLTAHNLPEGIAVAISTMGSVNLGFKLTIAIALHNIPEGLAIVCPLIMSKRYSPPAAIGIAFVSGLAEPVGALLTLLVLPNIITQEMIDYALAFVGGVMMSVALFELLPEALRLQRHAITAAGFISGVLVMSLSLYFLD